MLSGRRLDLLDPSPLDVEVEVIAHGLARVARWNGQTIGPHIFSVAQHTLLVEAIARPGGIPNGRRPFALLFHGPLTPILPQAMYRFEHPAFSPLGIFIVPVGPQGDRMRYEAIFA